MVKLARYTSPGWFSNELNTGRIGWQHDSNDAKNGMIYHVLTIVGIVKVLSDASTKIHMQI